MAPCLIVYIDGFTVGVAFNPLLYTATTEEARCGGGASIDQEQMAGVTDNSISGLYIRYTTVYSSCSYTVTDRLKMALLQWTDSLLFKSSAQSIYRRSAHLEYIFSRGYTVRIILSLHYFSI